MENKYYIYFHINPIKDEVFYVGKGTDDRAYQKRCRNKLWHRTVNKYGYEVFIAASGLTSEEACLREIDHIKHLGRIDLGNGNLVNMTDGGEGLINPSEETKRKISLTLTGRKQKPRSEEHKKNLSGRIVSEETRKKLSLAAKNQKRTPCSEETKEKMRISNKGFKHSEETKQKLRKPKTEEHRNNMRVAQLKRRIDNNDNDKLQDNSLI